MWMDYVMNGHRLDPIDLKDHNLFSGIGGMALFLSNALLKYNCPLEQITMSDFL